MTEKIPPREPWGKKSKLSSLVLNQQSEETMAHDVSESSSPHQAGKRSCQDTSCMSSKLLLSTQRSCQSPQAEDSVSRMCHLHCQTQARLCFACASDRWATNQGFQKPAFGISSFPRKSKEATMLNDLYHKGYYQRRRPRCAWGTAGSFLWTWRLWTAQWGCQGHLSSLPCHLLAIWEPCKLSLFRFGRFLVSTWLIISLISGSHSTFSTSSFLKVGFCMCVSVRAHARLCMCARVLGPKKIPTFPKCFLPFSCVQIPILNPLVANHHSPHYHTKRHFWYLVQIWSDFQSIARKGVKNKGIFCNNTRTHCHWPNLFPVIPLFKLGK